MAKKALKSLWNINNNKINFKLLKWVTSVVCWYIATERRCFHILGEHSYRECSYLPSFNLKVFSKQHIKKEIGYIFFFDNLKYRDELDFSIVYLNYYNFSNLNDILRESLSITKLFCLDVFPRDLKRKHKNQC